MKKSFVSLFFVFFLSTICFSQDIISITGKCNDIMVDTTNFNINDTIHLNANGKIFIDYIEIDNKTLSKLDLKLDKVRFYIGNNQVQIKTKFLVVFNGRLLRSDADKKKHLSWIKFKSIKRLIKLSKKEAIAKFGIKGINGALIIDTW